MSKVHILRHAVRHPEQQGYPPEVYKMYTYYTQRHKPYHPFCKGAESNNKSQEYDNDIYAIAPLIHGYYISPVTYQRGGRFSR